MSFEKNSLLSLLDDRSTKKVKFRAHGDDETLWSTTHGFSIIDLETNYFLVRFKLASDANYVLTRGPWTVLGHYLVVQRWSPSFDSSKEEIDYVIVWIRLSGMALHYYHKRILRMLGQIIGTMVNIDYNTESATRGKFARIAVEVAFNKPFVSQFLLDGKIQKVEYESLPHICFQCGTYGHFRELCPKRSLENDSQGVGVETVTDANSKGDAAVGMGSTSGNNPKFGPWMAVTRKGKNRRVKESANLRDHVLGNWNSFGKESRYGVLAKENDTIQEKDLKGATPSALNNHMPATSYNFVYSQSPKKPDHHKKKQAHNQLNDQGNQDVVATNNATPSHIPDSNKPTPMQSQQNLEGEDDDDDSDYMGDNDTELVSSEGDVSLDDENVMAVI
ncbi:DUF4283 domain-containing protein [Citrus sinensis]|uniref:DUF4283 domain-containing protein n=1 Tax=Citrus sinensis TaxID=2711 RepID=A0ACB8N0F7_CITSI|nr:DUF4283 domain-containing protein [Citrus sinensis]